ncbi:CocE/NonD family hydrolase [Nocardia sp. CDC160]|uniref:CocE/NonD family hydrolase n=1 Tax=Nocardia sp. CDC160 TaxID=3112166 RepID=UPI002DBA88CE|nr:CocE/NonD family hydrolase [Nocardia sp. CDC160]MEC3919116.1 CocE/NonD family hydrolase [Nocardia sp. CDC160]
MADPMPPLEPLPPDARFDIGPELYRHSHRLSDIAIRMRDGVVLSADLTRPGDRTGPEPAPLPVVVNFTPYNKIFFRGSGGPLPRAIGRWIGPSDRRRFTGRDLLHTPAGGLFDVLAASPTLVKRGYAYLMVDVRGTGSSTGRWDFFSADEQRDYLEVLRWVREQPWCDGRLALTGISYNAIAALVAAGLRPEGLAAVFAVEAGEDPIRELGLTGGVPSPGMAAWIAVVNGFKWVPSIGGLLAAGALRQYLRDRIADPISWMCRALAIAFTEHPDGYLNPGYAARLPRLERIQAPTWLHGGWHDVYNRSNFRMYDRLSMPPGRKQLVVDESYHVTPGCGHGLDGAPPRLDELQCAWFDRWVKGIDNGIERYGPVTLRQLGGAWVARDRYPHPSARLHRLYPTSRTKSGATLSDSAPRSRRRLPVPTRRPSLASNNTAVISMGISTLLGTRYGSDDRVAEATAITFTTAPFGSDVLVSGPMCLRLRVEADGTDAFWSVTLTDVGPDGASVAITRGALLSSLRAVDAARSGYVDGELVVPEHPFTAESVLPVTPGEPFDIDIEINPTEAVLRAGHRLRLAVSASGFPRHALSLPQRRKVKGQAIILDPRHPGYLAFTAVGLRAAEAGTVDVIRVDEPGS